MITGENYIGRKRSANGGVTYKTYNPLLNKENEWVFYEANVDELNEAVDMAQKAFAKYRSIQKDAKAKFLSAIAEEILNLGDELIKVYCAETGLPEGRAKGERGRTVSQLQTFAALVSNGSWVEAVIDTADANRDPSPKPDLRKMLVPIGPIAVFGASNFPLAFSTVGGDTASALAAGCPVVVKSHPMHAGTSELMASAVIKAAERTGMPDGVFSLLNSQDTSVGEVLVLHPGIAGVGFTGSFKGGRALHDLGAMRPNPIPVFAEMGSVNPTIILPKALANNPTELAKKYAASICLGTGQFCTNPGLFIVINGEGLSEFVSHLANALKEIDATCMLHPRIAEAYDKSKTIASNHENVEVIFQSNTDVKPNYAQTGLVSVAASDFLKDKDLQKEVFGPFSMIVHCEDLVEMKKAIKALDGQLTGTIIGADNETSLYPDVVSSLSEKVGRLLFNGVPTGVEVSAAMTHGGPYPATTDSRFTAVGTNAIKRWVRPLTFQDWPEELLPDALKTENPLKIDRIVDGKTILATK